MTGLVYIVSGCTIDGAAFLCEADDLSTYSHLGGAHPFASLEEAAARAEAWKADSARQELDFKTGRIAVQGMTPAEWDAAKARLAVLEAKWNDEDGKLADELDAMLDDVLDASIVEGGPVTIDREIGGKLELIAAFATIGAAEEFLGLSATIDPDDLEAGRYGINAPHGAQSDDEALVIAHALSAQHGRPFTPSHAERFSAAHAFNFDYHPDD